MNFFASWCAPCEVEHPQLMALKAQGVKVVGIAYKDAPANTQAFLTRLGDPFALHLVDRDGRAGLEFGVTPGLDWIQGQVKRLEPNDPSLTIPHMGWNAIAFTRAHDLFKGIEDGAHMYYANSFALTPSDPADVVATTDHGGPFTAAVAKDNVAGVQFHPEKSQSAGLALLANFLEWRP